MNRISGSQGRRFSSNCQEPEVTIASPRHATHTVSGDFSDKLGHHMDAPQSALFVTENGGPDLCYAIVAHTIKDSSIRTHHHGREASSHILIVLLIHP